LLKINNIIKKKKQKKIYLSFKGTVQFRKKLRFRTLKCVKIEDIILFVLILISSQQIANKDDI